MRRIIINLLLLASIVSAVPTDRHKRHFSFWKNLIRSAIFGENPYQTPPLQNVEPDAEYKQQQIPEFEDVTVPSVPNAAVIEEKVIANPGHELEISPLESYLGTKNAQETLVAFQNVNNLLSTGILNRRQNSLLRDTTVPIISGLTFVVDDKSEFVPIISETIAPVLTVVKPYELKKTDEDFETRYSYIRSMKKDKPLMTFTADNNPEVSAMDKIDVTSALPLCIRQRIDEVISLGADPIYIIPINEELPFEPLEVAIDQSPYSINELSTLGIDEPLKIELLPYSEFESRKSATQKSIPLHPLPLPLDNFNRPAHSHKVIIDTSELNKKAYGNVDTIEISQTLGPMPTQYIPLIEQSKDNIITDKNTVKKEDTVSKNGIVSHYVYKQTGHNIQTAHDVPKEGDELKTNVNTELPVPRNDVPITKITPEQMTSSKTQTPNDSKKPVDSEVNDANTSKSLDIVPEKNTQAKQGSHLGPNAVSMVKKVDELKTNSDSSNLHGSKPQAPNAMPILIRVPNTVKTLTNSEKNKKFNETNPKSANIVPDRKETLSQLINEEIKNNDQNTSHIKEGGDSKANGNVNPTLSSHYVYTSPVPNNISASKNVPKVVKMSDNKDNVKSGDIDPENETLSQYIYEEVSRDKPIPFSRVEEGDETSTNVNTDSLLASHYVYMPPVINTAPTSLITVKDDKLPPNKPTKSAKKAFSTNSPGIAVFSETGRISFRNDPIVVADVSYAYHQTNTNGSSIRVQANKDGVSVKVNEKTSKGRGDIPDE